jgi:hypothetical protein
MPKARKELEQELPRHCVLPAHLVAYVSKAEQPMLSAVVPRTLDHLMHADATQAIVRKALIIESCPLRELMMPWPCGPIPSKAA